MHVRVQALDVRENGDKSGDNCVFVRECKDPYVTR
jgi:hypothetical protein